MQQAINDDDRPILDAKGNNIIQSIARAALCISWFIDNTILVASNEIALNQSNSTIAIMNLCISLLDYTRIYPDPLITFKKSDIVLWVLSDSSYQLVSK